MLQIWQKKVIVISELHCDKKMIEIKINNCKEIAKSRNFMAKLLPSSVLHGMVEKAIAKKLQEKFSQEGIEAEIIICENEV